MTFERGITVSTGDKSTSASAKTPNQEDNNIAVIAEYEQTISTHLAKILFSDNPVTVIKAARSVLYYFVLFAFSNQFSLAR